MAFHNVSFPVGIAVGVSAPTTWPTEIVTARSGYENRNSSMAHARRRYEARVPAGLMSAQNALLEFWHGRRGPLYSFRFEDVQDHKSCAPDATAAGTDQTLGTGDASETVFQLVKIYDASGSAPYTRSITKPQTGTVIVTLDGITQTETTHYSVDYTTGVVTFVSPPGSSVVVAAGFHFDVPVRFEDEDLPATFILGDSTDGGGQIVEYPSVPMIEVRE